MTTLPPEWEEAINDIIAIADEIESYNLKHYYESSHPNCGNDYPHAPSVSCG